MPFLESQQFYNSVEEAHRKQKYAPFYLFFGDEPFLINQAVQYLKAFSLHGGSEYFSFIQYLSGQCNIEKVCEELETLPFMVPRKVILLREIQYLTEKEWSLLEPIFSHPNATTVFIMTGSKLDRRKKFFKFLGHQGIIVEFKRPYSHQIPGWIRHIARAQGLQFSDDAVLLMHALLGDQLSEIESEMAKVRDFLGERTQVEQIDIERCVSKRKEENVFELAELIAKGDRVESLVHLMQLLDQGQSEVGIVSLIARHMRILLLLKKGMSLGMNGLKLSQYTQIPQFYLQNYIKQSRFWNQKKLETAITLLADTDRALKSSPISSHIWLENLILRACELKKSSLKNSSTGHLS